MRPIQRILVAIKDPGAIALPAVAKAARIARASGAHVELFHAIKASVYANSPAAYEKALLELHETERRHYRQRLERIAARLRLHGIKVSVAIEYDYPAYDAIVRRARLIDADLIVARRRSERSAMPGLLRLADWELLRNSPIPVLLVKQSSLYRHPTVLAAIDPYHAHAKPAQLDAEILSAATQLTQALKGQLHAVHAYSPVVVGAAASAMSHTAASRLEENAARQAQMEFERLLQGTDIPRTRRHLVGDFPATAINATARRTRADIVVMGALSRSGLQRLLIGNTAERLLDELPCDLLIVKPAHFKSRVPDACNGPQLLAKAG